MGWVKPTLLVKDSMDDPVAHLGGIWFLFPAWFGLGNRPGDLGASQEARWKNGGHEL